MNDSDKERILFILKDILFKYGEDIYEDSDRLIDELNNRSVDCLELIEVVKLGVSENLYNEDEYIQPEPAPENECYIELLANAITTHRDKMRRIKPTPPEEPTPQNIDSEYIVVVQDDKAVPKFTREQLDKIAKLDLTKTRLEKEYFDLLDQLDEANRNIDKLDEQLYAIKTSTQNKQTLEELTRLEAGLILEISTLTQNYEKAKSDFDTYDIEFQKHSNQAHDIEKSLKKDKVISK